jgi:hypothetical protein
MDKDQALELRSAMSGVRDAVAHLEDLVQRLAGAGPPPDLGAVGQPSVPGPPAKPAPAAAPAKPADDDGDLDQLEASTLGQIQQIVGQVTQRSQQIQGALSGGYANPWGAAPQPLIMQQAQLYEWAITQMQMLRPTAEKLAAHGRPRAQQYIEANSQDCAKALDITRATLGQTNDFAIERMKIVADTNRGITSTLLDMNQKTRDAYKQANSKFTL